MIPLETKTAETAETAEIAETAEREAARPRTEPGIARPVRIPIGEVREGSAVVVAGRVATKTATPPPWRDEFRLVDSSGRIPVELDRSLSVLDVALGSHVRVAGLCVRDTRGRLRLVDTSLEAVDQSLASARPPTPYGPGW